MIERYPDKPTLSAPAILPMLPDGAYLAQFKYDGWRMVLQRTAAGWTFTSRHNKPLPVGGALRAEVADRLAHLPVGYILDGEWMERRAGVEVERIWLFDVMRDSADGGRWLDTMPTLARFARLVGLVPPEWVVPHTTMGYADFFERSKQDPAVEGIVLKALRSGFTGSVRECRDNPQWLKIKWRAGGDGQTRVA